jgi:hypothetical protein
MGKAQSFQIVQTLVERFSRNRSAYVRADSAYNESQLRADFPDPFLAALGWDVFNKKRAPPHLREVIHEDIVVVEDNEAVSSKKPDYAMRLGAKRKFFVEAKRPAVDIALL